MKKAMERYDDADDDSVRQGVDDDKAREACN